MKKADKKRLDDALNKALSPPPARRMSSQALDALLDEYDEAVNATQDQALTSESLPAVAVDVTQKPLEIRVKKPTPTPVVTGAPTPVTTPATVILAPPVQTDSPPSEEVKQQPLYAQYLDATHTASEQRIYSVMYRDTISKGISERHFGPKELSVKTGILSDRTIRTALHGLCEKLSLVVVTNTNGNPLGPRYRVYDPKEIIKKRKIAGIEIDPQSKKIIRKIVTPVATGAPTPVATGDKNYRGTPVETTPVTPVDITGVYKYINKDSELEEPPPLSSSKSSGKTAEDDDNAFLESVRTYYEELTGNTWNTADGTTAYKGREIPAEIWGIAICYCVDRAPDHKFDRLAYVLEEARNHHREMSGFSQSDLRVILRHSLSVIKRARQSGAWEPSPPAGNGG